MTEVFQCGYAVDEAFSFEGAIKPSRAWFTLQLLGACLALQRALTVSPGSAKWGRGVQTDEGQKAHLPFCSICPAYAFRDGWQRGHKSHPVKHQREKLVSA